MMAKAPAKKKPTARGAAVRAKIVKVNEPAPAPPKPPGGPLDKVLDLVKWIDTPFKLATVIVLGVLGLVGYIVYENQDKLIGSLTAKDHIPQLVKEEQLLAAARPLLRDVRAETIIIHEVDLPKNARTTRLAMSTEGRNTSLEGVKGALFSSSPARNRAVISMVNNEILCEGFQASSDAGDWLIQRGVIYACRASIPPEAGIMVGYIAVGFKQEPRDVSAVKARIQQATRDMAR
jgi:hypothetical protein